MDVNKNARLTARSRADRRPVRKRADAEGRRPSRRRQPVGLALGSSEGALDVAACSSIGSAAIARSAGRAVTMGVPFSDILFGAQRAKAFDI